MRPLGQTVKTPPFHGGIMGSIPVGVTKKSFLNKSIRIRKRISSKHIYFFFGELEDVLPDNSIWGISSSGRTFDLHSKGEGFKSPILHHLYSSLAQSVEPTAVNRVAIGSSPIGGAIFFIDIIIFNKNYYIDIFYR